jgi:hypothetical protein
VEVPSVVVSAPDDPVHPVGIAEQWAGGLADARLATVPSRDADAAAYRSGQRRALLDHVRQVFPGV